MKVIEFNHVWKKYKRGEKLNSIRDFLPSLFKNTLNGPLKKEEFWALQDVSFEIKKGEVVGIIGSNGAGKSTSLKLLAGIIKPNKGEVSIRGRLSALIEVTAGFHPELTGRENVYLNGTILGMRKKEIEAKFEQIVEFSGVGEFIDTPVKRYSSGMYSRLGFSVAAHMDPDILLVDEVLSVGDIAFQAKCAEKMRELLNSGATIILVSHNLPLIQNLCKRVILLNKGEIVKEGNPNEVIPYYQNIVYGKQEEELRKKILSDSDKVAVNTDSLVNISEVIIYNDELKHKAEFSVGEPISIKISYEAKKRIENPIFSIDIIRADGILCCSSNTKDDNFVIPAIDGSGSINIGLGQLNLAPTIYFVKLAIWDKEMVHPYVIRRKDVFRITLKNIKQGNSGVFFPEVIWELSQNDQSGHGSSLVHD